MFTLVVCVILMVVAFAVVRETTLSPNMKALVLALAALLIFGWWFGYGPPLGIGHPGAR